MITRIASRATNFVSRVFPERQIYHRADGQVRYFTLSTRTQVLAATASALALSWFAYATANVFLGGQILTTKSAEAERIKQRYERWLAEARAREASALALLQTRTTDFEEAAREFERRHATIKDLLEHATGRVEGRGRRMAAVDGGGDAILMTAAAEDPTPRRSRLALEASIRPAPAIPDPRLRALIADQDSLLDEAEGASEDRVENLRSVLRLTGLSPERVIEEGDRARGGPLIGLSQRDGFGRRQDFADDDPFVRRVARVAARVAEADRLERAIEAAPLGVPVDAPFRITSTYGPRLDPVTNQAAVHSGLDLGAYRLAPITAAAPGKVTFVGWKGAYGRTVEIDHGHGFKTRYGHMQKTDVTRGQQVSFGDKIGAMGSTGRSTGNHLHYEVWFKGKSYDPSEFLKAGQYVQQG